MTTEENLIINRILDKIFDGCKSCIIDSFEENVEGLEKLRARVQYEMVEKNAEMNDKEYDGLLIELLDFLDGGYKFTESYDKYDAAKMIDNLFNDPVFIDYNREYEERGVINKTLLLKLLNNHKQLLDRLELIRTVDKKGLEDIRLTDDDVSYLVIFYKSRKEQLDKVFDVIGGIQ